MPKKVVSIALSEESITKLEETSKALGKNRSELIDYMIQKGWNFSDEVNEALDSIKKLQNKIEKEIEADE
ncbi:MAG: ribbon-helix-helix protein, CopG family [Candidatus Bathyarchaeota archaeon]